MKRNRWLRLALLLVSLIVVSFGLAYLLQNLWAHFQLPPGKFAWLAYLTIFGVTLLCNLTIIAPVPVATSLMIAAATRWNPVLVSLFASIGGAIGELSGYYAGYLGKRIAIAELRQKRNNAKVKKALDEIKALARLEPTAENNLVPPVLDATRCYATVGEVCDILREVWGEYREPSVI